MGPPRFSTLIDVQHDDCFHPVETRNFVTCMENQKWPRHSLPLTHSNLKPSQVFFVAGPRGSAWTPTMQTLRGTGAIKRALCNYKVAWFLFRSHQFPLRAHRFPLRTLRSLYGGPFNCLFVGQVPLIEYRCWPNLQQSHFQPGGCSRERDAIVTSTLTLCVSCRASEPERQQH